MRVARFTVTGPTLAAIEREANELVRSLAPGHTFALDIELEPGVERWQDSRPSEWRASVAAHIRRTADSLPRDPGKASS